MSNQPDPIVETGIPPVPGNTGYSGDVLTATAEVTTPVIYPVVVITGINGPATVGLPVATPAAVTPPAVVGTSSVAVVVSGTLPATGSPTLPLIGSAWLALILGVVALRAAKRPVTA